MDYVLERKIKVSTESEFKSLYKWSLTEVDDNDVKANGDWLPFFWSLCFTAKSVEVHTRLSIEDKRRNEEDTDKTKSTSSQNKSISCKLGLVATWHRTRIKFSYSPKQDTNHRVITSVTTQVYGNTESAAQQKLKETYRSWTDFVIIEIDWG